MKILAAPLVFALTGGPTAPIEIVHEKLESGYHLVLAKMPAVPGRAPRVLVASYVLHGSMQESRQGWAHLMEHVAANNRSSIPGPARPEGISALEGNALARPYYTSFITVVPPALLAPTVHSRMARAGRHDNDSAVFVNEVGRVNAELRRDLAWQFPVYKSLASLSRGLSPEIADELAVINSTSRAELARAMAPLYRPDNAVLVIAGDIDLDSTLAMAQETDSRLRLAELRTAKVKSPSRPELEFGRAAVVKDQNTSPHHVVGIAWPKPPFGHADQLALLVADNLLLGRGDSVEDPVRSDSSPLAVRLAKSLRGMNFWDGRASRWQAPDIVDTGPGFMSVVFNTDSGVTTDQVSSAAVAALKDIRRTGMSDAEIAKARDGLADFYERWFFEPTFRILADHLMVYAITGRDPKKVLEIPARIRAVRPSEVRKAFDRYLTGVKPNVVVSLSDSIG